MNAARASESACGRTSVQETQTGDRANLRLDLGKSHCGDASGQSRRNQHIERGGAKQLRRVQRT
jgi:hypothetical protein